MKKKILIVMPGALELGGVERSLIGLLSSVDYDYYDVDLFLYGHHGTLFPMIDPHVNVLPECQELAHLRESFVDKIKHKCVYSAVLRLRDAVYSIFHDVNNDRTWAQVMRHCTKPLAEHYDVAMSFFLPFDFLHERVDASIKIGWIHTDYSAEEADFTYLLSQYSRLNMIVAVSEACKESFSSVFPQLASRVIVIENILPADFVKKNAEAFHVSGEMPQKGISLLSVGRFCEAKNFDNVPDICRRLVADGLDVKWYLIGYGGDEALIRQKIDEAGMQARVIILGKKDNPYPYMRACDLYVQPSRYEGKAVTVREAQLLGKPVVITDYATSGSQLEDGADGVIVPMDNAGCAAGIAALLRDPARMQQLSENCAKRDYTNSAEVEKIYALMED